MNWSTYMWQQLTVMAEMDAGDFYLISMLSWVWVCVVTCCHYMLVLLIVIIFIIKSVIYFAVWFSYPCDNCVLIDGKCDCAVFSWIIKRTEVCVNNIMQFLSLSSFLFNGIMHVLWWLFWWFFVVHKMFVSCCWWFFLLQFCGFICCQSVFCLVCTLAHTTHMLCDCLFLLLLPSSMPVVSCHSYRELVSLQKLETFIFYTRYYRQSG